MREKDQNMIIFNNIKLKKCVNCAATFCVQQTIHKDKFELLLPSLWLEHRLLWVPVIKKYGL
jgi:hypothetical protein